MVYLNLKFMNLQAQARGYLALIFHVAATVISGTK